MDSYCPFSDNCQVKHLLVLPFSMSLKKCIHSNYMPSLIQILNALIEPKAQKV